VLHLSGEARSAVFIIVEEVDGLNEQVAIVAVYGDPSA